MTPSDTAGLVARARVHVQRPHNLTGILETGELIAKLADALESLSRPVEGSWVMVPRVPTEAMRKAGDINEVYDFTEAWPLMIDAAPVFPTPVMGEEKMREILKAEMSKVDFTLPNRALVDAIMGSALAAMREVAELTGGK